MTVGGRPGPHEPRRMRSCCANRRPLPAFVQAMRHDHDTPVASYIEGCERCDIEKRLVGLRRQAEREHSRP